VNYDSHAPQAYNSIPYRFLRFIMRDKPQVIGPTGQIGPRPAVTKAPFSSRGMTLARVPAGSAGDNTLPNGFDWHLSPAATPLAGGQVTAGILTVEFPGQLATPEHSVIQIAFFRSADVIPEMWENTPPNYLGGRASVVVVDAASTAAVAHLVRAAIYSVLNTWLMVGAGKYFHTSAKPNSRQGWVSVDTTPDGPWLVVASPAGWGAPQIDLDYVPWASPETPEQADALPERLPAVLRGVTVAATGGAPKTVVFPENAAEWATYFEGWPRYP
jgi:hypothetical protein